MYIIRKISTYSLEACVFTFFMLQLKNKTRNLKIFFKIMTNSPSKSDQV